MQRHALGILVFPDQKSACLLVAYYIDNQYLIRVSHITFAFNIHN